MIHSPNVPSIITNTICVSVSLISFCTFEQSNFTVGQLQNPKIFSLGGPAASEFSGRRAIVVSEYFRSHSIVIQNAE